MALVYKQEPAMQQQQHSLPTVNIHEAKTNLSKLVEQAAGGEAFIIAKAGKPMVKVVPLEMPPVKRLGFLEGQGHITVDVDTFASAEIAAMFDGGA